MMRRCCESEKWEYTDLFWIANLISSTPLQKDALAIDMPKERPNYAWFQVKGERKRCQEDKCLQKRPVKQGSKNGFIEDEIWCGIDHVCLWILMQMMEQEGIHKN